jgi:hypothetical protein
MFGLYIRRRNSGLENGYVLNVESLHNHYLGELVMLLFLGNTFFHFIKLCCQFHNFCCSSLISCMGRQSDLQQS